MESTHAFAEAKEAPFASVGRADDWRDGEVKDVKVHKKPMAVGRIGDKFFALNSICPHMGGPISCGKLIGKAILCPWHSWAFDVETGACPNGHRIETYHVKVEDGEVMVGWVKAR